MAANAEPLTKAMVTAKLAAKLRTNRNVQGLRRKLDKYVAKPNVHMNKRASNIQFVSVSLLSVKFSMIGRAPSMMKMSEINPRVFRNHKEIYIPFEVSCCTNFRTQKQSNLKTDTCPEQQPAKMSSLNMVTCFMSAHKSKTATSTVKREHHMHVQK